jgi:hypothetical protein
MLVLTPQGYTAPTLQSIIFSPVVRLTIETVPVSYYLYSGDETNSAKTLPILIELPLYSVKGNRQLPKFYRDAVNLQFSSHRVFFMDYR